jgi:hypothetical protein
MRAFLSSTSPRSSSANASSKSNFALRHFRSSTIASCRWIQKGLEEFVPRPVGGVSSHVVPWLYASPRCMPVGLQVSIADLPDCVPLDRERSPTRVKTARRCRFIRGATGPFWFHSALRRDGPTGAGAVLVGANIWGSTDCQRGHVGGRNMSEFF